MKLSVAVVIAAYKWVLDNSNISFGIYGFFFIQLEIDLVLCGMIFSNDLDNLFH